MQAKSGGEDGMRVKKIREEDLCVVEYRASVIDGADGLVATDSGRMRLRAGNHGALGAIDAALVGARPGEKREMEIAPADAFGERDPELVMTLPRSRFGAFARLKPGSLLKLRSRTGREIEVVTREVNDKWVIVDTNHPLAGMTLKFEITVVAVEDGRIRR